MVLAIICDYMLLFDESSDKAYLQDAKLKNTL